MKEQVSIDEEFVEKVIDDVGMSPVAWDCVNPIDLCQSVVDVYLDSNEEIKRLKKLDENVKRQIDKFKNWRQSILKYIPGGDDDTKEFTKFITFLESLYE